MKPAFPLCLLIAANLPGMAQSAPSPAEPRDGMLRLQPSEPNKAPERRRPPVTQTEEPPSKHDGTLSLASPGTFPRIANALKPNSLEPFPDAVGGIDLVALAATGKAVKGDKQLAVVYGGKQFTFSTAEFRLAFQNEPERFLPEFGGYCAYHLAKGDAVPGRPPAIRVVSGRTYFFAAEAFAISWDRDRAALIGVANDNWSAAKKEGISQP